MLTAVKSRETANIIDSSPCYTAEPIGVPRVVNGARNGFAELLWPNGARRRISGEGVAVARRRLRSIQARNVMQAEQMATWSQAQLKNRREAEHAAQRELDEAVEQCLREHGIVPSKAGGYVVDESHYDIAA